jgi:hypothetical protein
MLRFFKVQSAAEAAAADIEWDENSGTEDEIEAI